MFPEPPRPPVKASEHFEAFAGGSPRYSDYKLKNPARCDECMMVVHEQWLATGKMGVTLMGSARYKRSNNKGTMLLCATHYNIWRLRDGR